MACNDKRAFIEDLASQAEEAAKRGEQRKLYKITKIASGKYRGATDMPIMDKQGRLLTSEAKQEAQWAEHCSEILNRPPPADQADIQMAEVDQVAPPEKVEIKAGVKSLKNGKAPGKDNLNAELFKADPEFTAEVLQPLFTDIWEVKKLPDDWTEGIIIKMPKKGAEQLKQLGWNYPSVHPKQNSDQDHHPTNLSGSGSELRKEQAGFRKRKKLH